MTGLEPGASEQGALFELQGPDEDGCVWMCSPEGRDVWCVNLGPRGPVAEKFVEWLSGQDYGERLGDWTPEEIVARTGGG